MHLPEKVKIGGIEYKVSEVEPDHNELDSDSWGCIEHEKSEIFISKAINIQKKEEVLIHEILHGIVDYVELDGELNDEYIAKISKTLYQVLKDNDLNIYISGTFSNN